jgi:hypothetical protein
VGSHRLIARLAARCLQLSQDELDPHCWVPSDQLRVIRNLEMIVDVFVKHSKTCSADINVGEVIIPCNLPQSVQHLDHLMGRKQRIIWHVTWIRWTYKRGEFDQQVHCWVHGRSRPSINEALGAIKLLKHLDHMPA